MTDNFKCSLRRGIDASTEELGKQIGENIPSTESELRAELPDNLNELVEESSEQADQAVREVLAEPPISQWLNPCYSDRIANEQ